MDRIKQNNIVEEIEKSFLDYSMSVIVARAIPDLRDGLKPVHRRILYSMYDSGYTPDKQAPVTAKAIIILTLSGIPSQFAPMIMNSPNPIKIPAETPKTTRPVLIRCARSAAKIRSACACEIIFCATHAAARVAKDICFTPFCFSVPFFILKVKFF